MATVGERLVALKERSGLSLAALAERAGYKNASSIQKLFRNTYHPERLSAKVAEKLSRAMVGLGDPPIQSYEFDSLSDHSLRRENRTSVLNFQIHTVEKGIPFNPTVPFENVFADESGSILKVFGSRAIEPMKYFEKPSHLTYLSLHAMIVSTDNMDPLIKIGDIIVANRSEMAEVGENVLAFVRFSTNVVSLQMIGTLQSVDDEHVILMQLNPPTEIWLRREHVTNMQPLLKMADLLGEPKSV